MVVGKAGKDLEGFRKVDFGSFHVVGKDQVFGHRAVTYGIQDVVFTHFMLSKRDGLLVVFLELYRVALTYKNVAHFFINVSKIPNSIGVSEFFLTNGS